MQGRASERRLPINFRQPPAHQRIGREEPPKIFRPRDRPTHAVPGPPFLKQRGHVRSAPLRSSFRAMMSNPNSVSSWADMRVFLQVAHARSFNKAGKQLGSSHATVARAVHRLESTLRAQLLLAGARGIVLTPSGLRLAQGLAKLDVAISEITLCIAPQGDATVTRSECDQASGAASALPLDT